jgi:CubicO group peptidase (beta-lactamase class C family)
VTSPDLAKLGYLYLNQGRWDRTQVVPADYVGASTRTHSAGRDNVSYGYHWWVETVGDHAAFFAQGAAGQFVEVVPDLDLVAVVTTSGERPLDRSKTLINSLIVPAVKL